MRGYEIISFLAERVHRVLSGCSPRRKIAGEQPNRAEQIESGFYQLSIIYSPGSPWFYLQAEAQRTHR
jgi:hypothetical protein